MNERIEELSKIAQKYVENSKYEYDIVAYHHGLAYRDKFAELIIKECLSIVDDAERGGNNETWDNAVNFIRRDLKEHFGIKDE